MLKLVAREWKLFQLDPFAAMSWSDDAADLDLWQAVHRVCSAGSSELVVVFGRVVKDDLERVAQALEEAMQGSSDEDSDDTAGGAQSSWHPVRHQQVRPLRRLSSRRPVRHLQARTPRQCRSSTSRPAG